MSPTHPRIPPSNRPPHESPKHTEQISTSSNVLHPNDNAAHSSKNISNTINNNITSAGQPNQQSQPTPTAIKNNPTTTFAEKLGNSLFPKKKQAIVSAQ